MSFDQLMDYPDDCVACGTKIKEDELVACEECGHAYKTTQEFLDAQSSR